MDSQPSILKRLPPWVYSLLPWFVLASTLGTTLFAWKLTQDQAEDKVRKEFSLRVAQLESSIVSRMQAYEQMLLGAKGLFAASSHVSRSDWRNYIEIQHFDENFPGLLAMGYAIHLSDAQLAEHERVVRDEGFPDYAVWPEHARQEYSSIVYIEPFSGRNLRAFGYDMLSEPIRHEAMQRARATGKASLSGKVRLVQEGMGKEQAGALLYVPIYRSHVPEPTPNETRAIQGWVYQPFRMDDLMHGLLPHGHLDLRLEIYNGEQTSEHLLFPSDPETDGLLTPAFSEMRTIPLYGQQWLMQVYSTPTFEAEMATDRPLMVALGGSLISLLCFGFTWSLARTQRNALHLAKVMNQELIESEQRFRDMFDNAPIAYQSLDQMGHFIDVNDRLCEMLGYSREELLAMNFDELWAGNHRHEFPGKLGEFRRQGHIEAELELVRKDGSPITVILVGRIQRNHLGEFLRTHCILTDISTRKLIETALQQSQAQLQQAIRAGGVGLWDWNLATDEVYFSSEYKRQIGYAEDEFAPTFEEWASHVHPDDLPGALQAIKVHNDDPERFPYMVEFRFRHKNGSYRWIQARGMTLFDENGKPARMMGSHTDITERHEKDEMLNLSSVVFESAEEGILVTDAECRIVMVNPAFTVITGYSPEEVIGHNPSMMSSGHHDRIFFQNLWDEIHKHGTWHGEIANRHKSGKHFLEWLSIRAVVDPHGQTTHYVGIFSDITERKEGEERMRYLAHYDALTGLPNRTLLLDRLQQAMAQMRRDHGRLAVMFLDLDRFKPVNDNLGHETGDRLLCEVAKRLQGCMRESDTVGRIGGDEFLLLLHNIEHQEDAALVARKIIDALEQPFDIDGHSVSISSSIGIALYPDHDSDESMLIKMADMAMYEAKSEKSGHFRIFDPSMLTGEGAMTLPKLKS